MTEEPGSEPRHAAHGRDGQRGTADRRRPEPSPIFVIGPARSGTTWVGNLLASHPAVFAATAPEHHGVIESHLLDYTRYALPGRMSAEEFIDGYEAEDYFRSLGLSRSTFLRGSDGEPADVIAHFGTMMRVAAEAHDARYWLEKTPRHAIYVDDILTRFPRARFVAVERDRMRTVRGQVVAFRAAGKSHVRTVVEKSLRYASDARGVERLVRGAPDACVVVKYEDLASDFEKETSRLLRFLELEPHALSSRFERYSSAPLGADGTPPWLDRMLVPFCATTARFVPFWVMRRLRVRRDATHGRGGAYYTRMAASSGEGSNPTTWAP